MRYSGVEAGNTFSKGSFKKEWIGWFLRVWIGFLRIFGF
jgi:hypothetical protein